MMADGWLYRMMPLARFDLLTRDSYLYVGWMSLAMAGKQMMTFDIADAIRE
jgi:hypothetical protein